MKRLVIFLCLLLSSTLLTGCSAEALAESIGQAYYCDLLGYHKVGDVWNDTYTTRKGNGIDLEFEFLETTTKYFDLKITVVSVMHSSFENTVLLFKERTPFDRVIDEKGHYLSYDYDFYIPTVYKYTYTAVFDSDTMVLRFYLREERSSPLKYIKSDLYTGTGGWEVYLKLE